MSRANAPPVSGQSGAGPARLVQAALGCGFLGLAVWLLWDFPVGRPWLLVLAAGLAAAQWTEPRAWLVALPLVFVGVDLGVWSGRLLAGEQDALLAVIAGAALLAGHYRGAGRQLVRRSFIPVWLLVLALGVGLARGLSPLTELDANAWNGYLTGWNALRVAKGPLWALTFWPLLAAQLRADRERTEALLALGLVLSLVVFGVYVLWERGLFVDLCTARDLWGLVSTWLDLSATYRITGPFSQMHLGGEAVDGYLVLAWPFALLVVLRSRRWPLTLLATAALALAAYAVMMTFTRTTYLAVGLSFLTFVAAGAAGAVGVAGNLHLSVRALLAVVAYVLTAVVLFLIGYRFGGTLLAFAYLAVALGGIVAGLAAPRLPAQTLAGGVAILFAAGAALALRGMLTSKWSHIALVPAMAIVVPSVLALGTGGVGLGRLLRPHLGRREAAILLICFGLFLPAVTLSLSGTQIKARAATAGADLNTRLAHWERSLSLMPDDLRTRLFGQGLGTFPLTNLLLTGNTTEGNWRFARPEVGSAVSLAGSSDLHFAQRLVGLSPGVYRVQARVRNPTGKPIVLVVRLQPRHLLELERWQPLTRELRIKLGAQDYEWREVEGRLDLGPGSVVPWYDPRVMVFDLSGEGAIDLMSVRLLDLQGRDQLANGDFAAGGDRWFAYNDFQHLAWHLKSLYVALYFDLGLLGLAAFGIFAAIALGRALGQARRGHLFSAAVAAALVGFLALGTTGTLLDVPVLMTLFLLLGIAALWRERVRRRVVKRTGVPAEPPGSPLDESAAPGT